MKILVLNSGSSSIKFQLFDMRESVSIASGLIEQIGEKESFAKIGYGSVNLEKNFYIHFKGCESGMKEANHGHVYFGFKGESLINKIKNFIIISKIWEKLIN